MWISGKLNSKDFAGYVVSQLIGAVIGAGFLYWFVDMSPEFNFGGVTGANNLATNVLQPGATSGMALLTEILLTFFLYSSFSVLLTRTTDSVSLQVLQSVLLSDS